MAPLVRQPQPKVMASATQRFCFYGGLETTNRVVGTEGGGNIPGNIT